MDDQLGRACPITTRYLRLVGAILNEPENMLMYEAFKPEYEKAVEKARTAGSSVEVQHLRGFVIVEKMAGLLDQALWVMTGDKPVAPARVRLVKRTHEQLTQYLNWINEELPEMRAELVHYRHYSSSPQREVAASHHNKAIEVAIKCAEAVSILRRALYTKRGPSPIIAHRYARCCLAAGMGVSGLLTNARNLLEITERHAPRGWELP